MRDWEKVADWIGLQAKGYSASGLMQYTFQRLYSGFHWCAIQF